MGGINLNNASVVAPGHAARELGSTHDVYVEVRGPSADRRAPQLRAALERGERPRPAPTASGPTRAARTCCPSRARCRPRPATCRFRSSARSGASATATTPPAVHGRALRDRRRRALDPRPILEGDRGRAPGDLHRGPGDRRGAGRGRAARRARARRRGGGARARRPQRRDGRRPPRPQEQPFFDSLAALGKHDHFALAGIAANSGPGAYQNVYVHAKIALVDDVWSTIGSANIGNRSFFGDTELNASFWHRPTVPALRRELLLEHLGHDTRRSRPARRAAPLPRRRAQERGAASGRRADRRASPSPSIRATYAS